jgi:murein DD-endopeptidase MepM/ murein hydrolase activator NlpD
VKKKIQTSVIAGLLLLVAAACSNLTKVKDAITKPTAREIYKREFREREDLYNPWQAAYDLALSDNIEINFPYGEKGKFNPRTNLVYSYTLSLDAGEALSASVMKDSLSQRVFMDLYEWNGSSYQLAERAETGQETIDHPAKGPGKYKLIIQPEIMANSKFFISINKKPVYGFPVAGKGNSAIQSFWADERDGGKRSHEGIDIFAKRGTPVVAVTEGTISYTGERGLGGKQVWLRAGIFGNSVYYAHLDKIAVTSGTQVKEGDTLGFVGNTGNARTTPPHLHFGIYSGYGALNPLPFIYRTQKITSSDFPRKFNSPSVKITTAKATLRQAPESGSPTIGYLAKNEVVTLLGENKNWLHIQTAASQKAFVHKSLVRGI